MKNVILRLMAVVLTLILSLTLIGCGGSGDQSQQNQPSATTPGSPPAATTPTVPVSPDGPSTDGGPEYGGIFRIGSGADTAMPLGFPWEHQVFPTQFFLGPYVEPLLEARQDGTFGYSLATDYKADPEKLEIVFTLREGVTFSDGSPFNAEVVAWNVQMQIDAREMNPAVTGAEVRGEYQIAILLNQYLNSIFPIFSNRPFSQISKENYEKNGSEYARTHPVGTGPFTLKEQIPGSSVSFIKRDDYWREGMPYLDGVEFIAMSDVMTQNAAMMSTGSDAIDELTTGNNEQVAFLRDNAPVYILDQPGGYSALIPSSMNEGDPLQKLEIRQAVSYAIDRESLVAARGYGIARPATQLLAEGFIGHIPDESVNVRFDPDKSRDLLAAAGYPNGFSTTIICDPGGDRDSAVAIQSMLGDVGITAELEFPEAGAFTETRNTTWDGLLFMGIGNFTNSGTSFRLQMDPDNQWFPRMWRPGEEMRDDFDKLRGAITLEDEEYYAMRVNSLLMENMIMIPVVDTTQSFVLKNNVHDTGFAVHTPQTVWLPYATWKESKAP